MCIYPHTYLLYIQAVSPDTFFVWEETLERISYSLSYSRIFFWSWVFWGSGGNPGFVTSEHKYTCWDALCCLYVLPDCLDNLHWVSLWGGSAQLFCLGKAVGWETLFVLFCPCHLTWAYSALWYLFFTRDASRTQTRFSYVCLQASNTSPQSSFFGVLPVMRCP